MRAFSPFVAAGCWTLIAASLTSGADGVRWEPDFETAMQKAAQQNRLVLVHFWNDGCPPCEVVERYVFPHPQVTQAIERSCLAVKVHAGRRGDLAQRFGVTRWPTDVILTPHGQKAAMYVSPQDPRQYSETIQQIASREQGRLAQLAGGGASTFPLGANMAGRASYETQAGGEFPLPNQSASAPPQNDYGSAFRGAIASPQAPYSPQQSFAAQPPMPQHQGAVSSPYAGALPTNASPYGGVPAQPSFDASRTSAYPGALNPTTSAAMQSPYGGQPQMNTSPAPQGLAPNAPSSNRALAMPNGNGFGQTPAGNAPAQVGQAPPNPSFGAPSPANGLTGNPPVTPPQTAQGAPQFAMDGYCVVSLVEQLHLPLEQQKWRKGDPRFGAVHRGQTYLFAGQGEQQRFLANPDYYTPVLSGYDPVTFVELGQLVSGKRDYGFTHEGKIYMFESEQNLQKFWASRDAFIARVQQAMNASAAQQRR